MMKIMPKNLLAMDSSENFGLTLTANSQDPNYPIENMYDPYPKNVWKASDDISDDLIFTLTGDTLGEPPNTYNAIEALVFSGTHIFFTNFSWRCNFTMKCRQNDIVVLTKTISQQRNMLWLCLQDYIPYGELRFDKITFEISTHDFGGSIPQCGIARFGWVDKYVSPSNLDMTMKDNSIVVPLQGGGFYTRDRNRSKQYSITFEDSLIPASNWQPAFLRSYDYYGLGASPVPILLHEGDGGEYSNFPMMVFGSISDVSYRRSIGDKVTVSFKITEQI